MTVTPSRGGSRRTPIAIGLAVLALALLVGAVGAYLFLPSASIIVTPKSETLGPIQVTVVADPTTTEPDVEAGTVPGRGPERRCHDQRHVPGDRQASRGDAAKGTVQFRNVDFTASNTIAGGSIVSTAGGIRFRTNETVTVGAATLVGLQIVPKTASVGSPRSSPDRKATSSRTRSLRSHGARAR